MKSLSRRDFLKISSLGLTAAAALAIAGCGKQEETGAATGNVQTGTAGGSTSTGGTSTGSTGATTGGTPAVDPDKGGRIVMAGGNPTEFFTPYKQGTMSTYGWAVYEPLAWDKKDNYFEPCLAESWEVDIENKSLTIKLNEGTCFSDGSPLTADDVVFSLSIRQEYGTQGLIGGPNTIEKIDERTIKVVWDVFSLNFEVWVLTQFIYSKSAYESNGLDWMLTNMMGSGPYILEEFIPDVHMLFTRNPNYWRDITPDADEIEFVVIKDLNAQAIAFMNGEIDWIRPADPIAKEQIIAAGYEGYTPPNAVATQNVILPISITPTDPLANQAVRVAIFNGIDWEDMAKTVYGPDAFHIDAIGRPDMSYYKDTLDSGKYDPEASRKAIADAGYPDGFDLSLYCTNLGSSAQAAAYVQDGLKALNIRAEVVPVDYTLLNGEYLTGIAVQSGIVFTAYGFFTANQPDKFMKFLSPVGAFKGATAFPQEVIDLWEKVPSATTYEEQDEALYNYVDAYVNKYALVWPTVNQPPMTNYYNDWCYYDEMAFASSAGYDPFYMYANN